MSMTQSAVLMTSRLCSITTIVLPGVAELVQHGQQELDVGEVQAVVGSSRMYRVRPVSRLEAPAPASRAGPRRRTGVVALCPSVM
jgi:hypothetical protein